MRESHFHPVEHFERKSLACQSCACISFHLPVTSCACTHAHGALAMWCTSGGLQSARHSCHVFLILPKTKENMHIHTQVTIAAITTNPVRTALKVHCVFRFLCRLASSQVTVSSSLKKAKALAIILHLPCKRAAEEVSALKSFAVSAILRPCRSNVVEFSVRIAAAG